VKYVLIHGDSDFSGGQTKLPKILLNGNNICMVSQDILPGKAEICGEDFADAAVHS
jgi:hypothetical protein